MIYDYFLFGVGVPTYIMSAFQQSLFFVCFFIFIYVIHIMKYIYLQFARTIHECKLLLFTQKHTE